MAKDSLGHLPSLTADALMQAFETQFGDRYEVIPTPDEHKCDFYLWKSNLACLKILPRWLIECA